MDNNNNFSNSYGASTPEPNTGNYNPDQEYGFTPENATPVQPQNQSVNQTEYQNSAFGQPQSGTYNYGQQQTQYNQQAQYNQQTQYNQQAQYNQQTQYNQQASPYQQYNNYGAQTMPVDVSGNPIKNNFGVKLTLAIICTILSCCGSCFGFVFAVLAIIFVCLANGSFNKQEWEKFKSQSRTATIMLIISAVLIVIGTIYNIVAGNFTKIYDMITTGSYSSIDDDEDEDEDAKKDSNKHQKETETTVASQKETETESESEDDVDYYEVTDQQMAMLGCFTLENADFNLFTDKNEAMTTNGFLFETKLSEETIAASDIKTYSFYTSKEALDNEYPTGLICANNMYGDEAITADQTALSSIEVYLNEEDEYCCVDATSFKYLGMELKNATIDDFLTIIDTPVSIDSYSDYTRYYWSYYCDCSDGKTRWSDIYLNVNDDDKMIREIEINTYVF